MHASKIPADVIAGSGRRAGEALGRGVTAEAKRPQYRPSIDGLRAISIGVVLAYHAFPSVVRGGFCGVDVFFVISGYLITTIIRTEATQGTFSLAHFYFRRAVRLFPALCVVFVSTFLLGWVYLTGDEFAQFGKHLAASAAFLTNFSLWSESGYFAAPGTLKPFLHLWSLGIEEQFYLLWPTIILLTLRLRATLLAPAITILTVSFALSVFYTSAGQMGAAYYSPLSRFWELMIGAVMASGALSRPSLAVSQVCSTAGIVLIVGAVALLDSTSPFPGWRALAPTIGAALVLHSDDRTVVNRILSIAPLVFVGLISYPLYLWHWPPLALANILGEGEVSDGIRLIALASSFLLAIATYFLVEKPIRRLARGRSISTVGLCLATSIAALGVLGAVTWKSAGFPSRTEGERPVVNVGETGHDLYFKHLLTRFFPCELSGLPKEPVVFDGRRRCLQSKPARPPDLVILGDSHGEDLLIGLAEQLPDRNVASIVQDRLPIPAYDDVATVINVIEGDVNVRTVIIASAFAVRVALNQISGMDELRSALADLIRRFSAVGKEVYLVDDLPDFGYWAESCKYALRRAPWRSGATCDIGRPAFDRQQREASAMLAALHETFPAVPVLRSGDAFCDNDTCKMAGAGVLWFRDAHHLTIAGSKHLGQSLLTQKPALRFAH